MESSSDSSNSNKKIGHVAKAKKLQEAFTAEKSQQIRMSTQTDYLANIEREEVDLSKKSGTRMVVPAEDGEHAVDTSLLTPQVQRGDNGATGSDSEKRESIGPKNIALSVIFGMPEFNVKQQFPGSAVRSSPALTPYPRYQGRPRNREADPVVTIEGLPYRVAIGNEGKKSHVCVGGFNEEETRRGQFGNFLGAVRNKVFPVTALTRILRTGGSSEYGTMVDSTKPIMTLGEGKSSSSFYLCHLPAPTAFPDGNVMLENQSVAWSGEGAERRIYRTMRAINLLTAEEASQLRLNDNTTLCAIRGPNGHDQLTSLQVLRVKEWFKMLGIEGVFLVSYQNIHSSDRVQGGKAKGTTHHMNQQSLVITVHGSIANQKKLRDKLDLDSHLPKTCALGLLYVDVYATLEALREAKHASFSLLNQAHPHWVLTGVNWGADVDERGIIHERAPEGTPVAPVSVAHVLTEFFRLGILHLEQIMAIFCQHRNTEYEVHIAFKEQLIAPPEQPTYAESVLLKEVTITTGEYLITRNKWVANYKELLVRAKSPLDPTLYQPLYWPGSKHQPAAAPGLIIANGKITSAAGVTTPTPTLPPPRPTSETEKGGGQSTAQVTTVQSRPIRRSGSPPTGKGHSQNSSVIRRSRSQQVNQNPPSTAAIERMVEVVVTEQIKSLEAKMLALLSRLLPPQGQDSRVTQLESSQEESTSSGESMTSSKTSRQASLEGGSTRSSEKRRQPMTNRSLRTTMGNMNTEESPSMIAGGMSEQAGPNEKEKKKKRHKAFRRADSTVSMDTGRNGQSEVLRERSKSSEGGGNENVLRLSKRADNNQMTSTMALQGDVLSQTEDPQGALELSPSLQAMITEEWQDALRSISPLDSNEEAQGVVEIPEEVELRPETSATTQRGQDYSALNWSEQPMPMEQSSSEMGSPQAKVSVEYMSLRSMSIPTIEQVLSHRPDILFRKGKGGQLVSLGESAFMQSSKTFTIHAGSPVVSPVGPLQYLTKEEFLQRQEPQIADMSGIGHAQYAVQMADNRIWDGFPTRKTCIFSMVNASIGAVDKKGKAVEANVILVATAAGDPVYIALKAIKVPADVLVHIVAQGYGEEFQRLTPPDHLTSLDSASSGKLWDGMRSDSEAEDEGPALQQLLSGKIVSIHTISKRAKSLTYGGWSVRVANTHSKWAGVNFSALLREHGQDAIIKSRIRIILSWTPSPHPTLLRVPFGPSRVWRIVIGILLALEFLLDYEDDIITWRLIHTILLGELPQWIQSIRQSRAFLDLHEGEGDDTVSILTKLPDEAAARVQAHQNGQGQVHRLTEAWTPVFFRIPLMIGKGWGFWSAQPWGKKTRYTLHSCTNSETQASHSAQDILNAIEGPQWIIENDTIIHIPNERMLLKQSNHTIRQLIQGLAGHWASECQRISAAYEETATTDTY